MFASNIPANGMVHQFLVRVIGDVRAFEAIAERSPQIVRNASFLYYFVDAFPDVYDVTGISFAGEYKITRRRFHAGFRASDAEIPEEVGHASSYFS